MRAFPPLMIAVLLVVASGCGNTQASSIPEWSAPPNYAFTLDSSCGERALIGKFRVVVEGGTVADAEGLDESGRAMFEHGFGDEVPTLAELVDEAATAAEQGAEVVDVQTTEDGRPRQIDIDWDTNAIDDEACYRITDYTDQGGTSDAGSDLAAGEVAARVHSATFEAGGKTVQFAVDICERPLLRFTVEETPEEVRVRAVTTDDEDPADCATGTTATLDEPLGDRTIVDVGTDEPITQIHGPTE